LPAAPVCCGSAGTASTAATPYYAGANASAAVLNTNLCTAVAMLVWVGWDYAFRDKPSLIGSVNGMITGLVAITPSAGFVTGWGDHRRRHRLDDRVVRDQVPQPSAGVPQRGRHARGDLHPRDRGSDRRSAGRIHGSWTLLRWQAEAGLWVIVFSGVMTFILLKLVGIFVPLRLSDEELEIGDHAIHGNEVYPSDVPTLGGPHAPAWQPGSGAAMPAGAGA
jgi:Amt family ammonium transporter